MFCSFYLKKNLEERFRQRSQSIDDLRKGNFETIKRARQMYEMNPNLKLFFFIRDPVQRVYSQVTQIFRPNMARLRSRLKEYANPSEVRGFEFQLHKL